MKNNDRRMVRYSEGALLYSMGLTMFQRLAKEANAVYIIEGMPPLVKCDVFETYIEKYRAK
ncbi:hypothetical protein BXO88_15865 [Oribacterium sp. C9]|uniref:DUF6462 family protein n=1 Tax=Oribacterium sp. C9 TaxID=1943579 RepID=UPI00098FFAD8|nr:DUF6462 family protein [Oribacterium sp. C9]OON84727.1 hypothetical protein BXO88_15865 [Oribacterium sp. C9]